MTILSNHPRVEVVRMASLIENVKSARRHSATHLEQLAASLDRFGYIEPIIVDDELRIVAGHGRYKAAQLRGFEEIPVIRVRFLSEADRRAYALAANRLAELSEWDEKLLNAELGYLFEEGYDFSVTGFELSDLDVGFNDSSEAEEPPVELPDPNAQSVSRLDDLWLIGPHRLYHGSSRLSVSLDALLAGERARMIMSDNPYNLRIPGVVSGLGRKCHGEFVEASGEMSPVEFTAFLRDVFRNCVRNSTEGSIHYHFMDWRHMREILDAADGVYSELKQLVVWSKTNASMGSFYRSAHELIFVFKSGKGKHINNFGLGAGGRFRTNVWTYAGANTFRKGRAQDLDAHPTVKPLNLVMDAIIDCSNPGDLILDPFSGSGTTLVAAHHTKRRGAAIELDGIYVDTSLRRLAAASGLTPRHADGRTFDEVAAERASSSEKVDD